MFILVGGTIRARDTVTGEVADGLRFRVGAGRLRVHES